MKLAREDNSVDGIAEPSDTVEVEIVPEVGWANRYKLYIHLNGETVLRICKLESHQITGDIQLTK